MTVIPLLSGGAGAFAPTGCTIIRGKKSILFAFDSAKRRINHQLRVAQPDKSLYAERLGGSRLVYFVGSRGANGQKQHCDPKSGAGPPIPFRRFCVYGLRHF